MSTTLGADVEIRRYDDSSSAPVGHLLKLLWSPDRSLNYRQLLWKYDLNPYGRGRIYAACDGGKIVAMRGFYGARYVSGAGTGQPAVMCTGDLVIAPGYRGRGVFTHIMARALEDFSGSDVGFLLNFSASASVRLGSLAAGWGSTAPVRRFRRLGRAAASKRMLPDFSSAIRLARWIEQTDSMAGRATRRLTRWAPFAVIDVGASSVDGVTISSSPRPAEMADLIRRIETDGRIRHQRDETYFGWRFGNPMSSYRFFFLGGSSLEAYGVVQARHHPMRGKAIRIVDWAGTSGEARRIVLRAAVAAIPHFPIDAWGSSLADEDLAALQAEGFMEAAQASAAEYSPAVLVRPVATPIPPRPWSFDGLDILDIRNWNLRLLDSDGS